MSLCKHSDDNLCTIHGREIPTQEFCVKKCRKFEKRNGGVVRSASERCHLHIYDDDYCLNRRESDVFDFRNRKVCDPKICTILD